MTYHHDHKAGLRFVGYADELASLNHKGWFTHPDGFPDETLRGGVWVHWSADHKAAFCEGAEISEFPA
jgi:hypothetical protein